MAKKVTGIILLTSLMLSGVFGILLIHSSDHSLGCIATKNDIQCPFAINPFKQFSLHAEFFKDYSTAISVNLTVLFFLLLGFLLALPRPAPEGILFSAPQNDFSQFSNQPGFLNWIALHERRDPSARII